MAASDTLDDQQETESDESTKPGGQAEKSGSGIKGILISAAFTYAEALGNQNEHNG